MGDIQWKSRYNRKEYKENLCDFAILVGQGYHPPGTTGFLVTFANGITHVGIPLVMPYILSSWLTGEQKKKKGGWGNQETLTWSCPEQFPRCE